MAWTKQGNIKGPVGVTGSTGPKGADGKAGTNGAKGDPGATGPTGPAGADGHVGAKGLKGDTGTKGLPGPAGPKGNDGVKGVDGKAGTGVSIKGSAAKADILAKAGAAGDMWLITSAGADHGDGLVSNGKGAGAANWTDVGAIQGPKGDAGVAGAAGPKGAAGISWHLKGRDTEAVIKAKTGVPGDMWIIAEPGHTKDGHALGWDPLNKPNPGWRDFGQFKGDKGDAGVAGHAGAKGTDGKAGAGGATGPAGAAGAKGDTGERGAKWFSGATVPSGTIAGSKAGDFYLDTASGDVYELS